MLDIVRSLLRTRRSTVQTHRALAVENLALRHQLMVLPGRTPGRAVLSPADRLLWIWLAGSWRAWRAAQARHQDLTDYRCHVQDSPSHAPSPTWRTFLRTHARDLVAVDFFTVPTATFQMLFVCVILSHHRRRIVHLNVTANPTAEWTAQHGALREHG